MMFSHIKKSIKKNLENDMRELIKNFKEKRKE